MIWIDDAHNRKRGSIKKQERRRKKIKVHARVNEQLLVSRRKQCKGTATLNVVLKKRLRGSPEYLISTPTEMHGIFQGPGGEMV